MTEIQTLTAAARNAIADPARTRVIRGAESETPRLELFHSGISMCSMKVRAALAEKDATYTSHDMVVSLENYHPDYVRLRLLGGSALGQQFAQEHTGRSSVDTEGFDPCVVPLLVDHEKQQVVVDSKLILQHIDRELPGAALIPAHKSAEVMRQVAIVDETPHPGILYGFHPDDDRRPDFLRERMKSIHNRKVEVLRERLESNHDDPELVSAYQAKISKELAGKELAFDPQRQQAVRVEVEGIIGALDAQLSEHADPWVCGSDFTLADCVWGISLYRIHWLGLASLWSSLPRVQAYAKRAYARPSMANDVINWPTPMPPSPHVADVAELKMT